MKEILEYIIQLKLFSPIVRTLVVILILLTIHRFVMRSVKRNLLRKAKTKKQKSNVEIFFKVMNYAFIVTLIIFIIISYAGSLAGLGLGLGLLSAALGWALQTPITGFAAWIMIIINRPFDIGDRIIVGDKKGDVIDITPTHIILKEIGGTVPSAEEYSGRTVIVPNANLFTQDIINYTLHDDYVLGEVIIGIPYECNLKKAIKIGKDAAKKFTSEYKFATGSDPRVRLSFEASSVDIKIRYHVPATKLSIISTKITEEIFHKMSKEKDVEIAYPHTEIIYRKK